MEANYNTKEGIAKSLGSLEELTRLLSERRDAWGRDEELSKFFIFGRYRLDDRGHMEEFTKKIPKEIFPDIPNVMTDEEFIDYIEKHPGKMTKHDLWDSAYKEMVIEPGLKCPSCGLAWDINNIHEAQIHRNCEWIPINEFAGKTLDEVIKALNEKHDGIYYFGPSDHRDGDYIVQPDELLWTSIIRLSCSDCKKV